MIQQTMLMHYHLSGEDALRDQGTIERFLTEVAGLGYSLATFTYPVNLAALIQNVPSETPGKAATALSPMLQSDLELFAGGKNASLWVLAFPEVQKTPFFKCGIAFHASSATLSLIMRLETIAFATSENEGIHVFEQWLTFFQQTYAVWQPIYAHSLVPASKWPEPTEADLKSGHVPYLYEINFFGPDLVEGLGKERLQSVPAWRVQALANGGMALVPECIYARRDPHLWEAALHHLAMKRAFWHHYVPVARPA